MHATDGQDRAVRSGSARPIKDSVSREVISFPSTSNEQAQMVDRHELPFPGWGLSMIVRCRIVCCMMQVRHRRCMKQGQSRSATSETTPSSVRPVTMTSTTPPPFLVRYLPPASDRPSVTLTWAQSLDSKIAGKDGARVIISGPETMLMTHWYVVSAPSLVWSRWSCARRPSYAGSDVPITRCLWSRVGR